MIKYILSSLLLVFFSAAAFADKGKLTGTLIDGGNNEALAYASVLVKETQTAVTSDFEGDYLFELEEGIYTLVFSFVGYETKEVESVRVEAGKPTIVDVTLNPLSDLLDAVVITTTTRQNTDVSLLRMQKSAGTLMDGLSSQSIRRTGASDIAAAVKAVPGVSVQEGKYVFVRGLGDRYTKSVLNGMDIPGLDPDKNTIQMDVFPTNILENIVISKSASADLPADFTGGVVDIVTKDFPSVRQFGISVSGGFNPDMHLNGSFLGYKGGKTDFLGFDDGTRELPVSPRQVIPNPASANNETLDDITRAFDPTMAAQRQRSPVDMGIGFNYGNQYNLAGNKLGVIASLDYKNNTSFYYGFENGIYQKPEEKNAYELRVDRRQQGDLGIRNVLASALAGLAYKTDRAKYTLNLLRIQNGESRAAVFGQRTEISNVIDVTKDNLEYTQRSISNLLLSGKHTSEDASWTMEWKLSPTISRIHDKDVRLTTFIDQNGTYTIGSDAGFPMRIWRNLEEINLVGKADITRKYQFLGSKSVLKFGGLYSYKQRDYSINNFDIANRAVHTQDLNGDPDAILAGQNVWTPETNSGYYIRGNFQPANTYDATQNTAALYISNEFIVHDKLRTILGVRAEKFTSYFTGQNNSGSEVYSNEKTIDKIDLFPSANFIYSLADQSNLRFSYSRTTARPTFRELSVVQISDLLTGIVFLGNLDLKPTYINNLDLRYEFFGEGAEMFAISSFYKKFVNPIELVAYSIIAPNQFTPRNAPSADVYGIELEARKNFGFVSGALEKLSVNMNLSFIDSRIEINQDPGGEYESKVNFAREGEHIGETRQLQGQSPMLINTGLSYNNPERGFEIGVFYNVQGETLSVVGFGKNPDVFVQPFNSLNLNFGKKLGKLKNSSISFKAENLLGEIRESLYDSYGASRPVFESRTPGRTFSLGYSLTF